jgi:hypothetical protein
LRLDGDITTSGTVAVAVVVVVVVVELPPAGPAIKANSRSVGR